MIVADVTVNLLFKRPADPRTQMGTLAQYFEYGRSTQGKLTHLLGETDATATAIATAGWLHVGCNRTIATSGKKHTVSVYGMSFSSHVGEALRQVDDSIGVELFAGPGAPPNHSFKCFNLQQAFTEAGNTDTSDIQILGILASSLKGMLSFTGATTGFEGPAPFTYPRYVLNDKGELVEIAPPVTNTADWRDALHKPDKLQRVKSQLAQYDHFYDPLLFNATIADRSSVARMMRRAYAQHRSRDMLDAATSSSTLLDRQISPALRAMATEFARASRSAGKRPIVLLLQDKGSGNNLSDILKETLVAERIDFISTHDITPPTDPSNFVSDGHFTAAANVRIATKLRELICRNTSCMTFQAMSN